MVYRAGLAYDLLKFDEDGVTLGDVNEENLKEAERLISNENPQLQN